MSNLKLPTTHSKNWGNSLNAYIESLNSRISDLEKYSLGNRQSNTTVVQNLGCYSSGLVGNSTKIDYTSKTITVTDLNAYLGGDIMTFYNVTSKTYTFETATMPNKVAFYVFLAYDMVKSDFDIVMDVNLQNFNYTRILIGFFYKDTSISIDQFVPIYYSNLKTIAQHLDEYTRATIELDTYKVPIEITVANNINPLINFGDWGDLKDVVQGPIINLTGIGYKEDEGTSKWYNDDKSLDSKIIKLSSTPKIIYLEDYVSGKDGKGPIRTRMVEGFSNYLKEDNPDRYASHYFRILLTPFDDIIVVQKSAEVNYMSPVEYYYREQNLRNKRFNSIFTELWVKDYTENDGKLGVYTITGSDTTYELALDALFCIEVGRFAHNTLSDDIQYDSKDDTKNGILFNTLDSVYPYYNIDVNYVQDKMCADTNHTGLYGTTTTDVNKLIQSAKINEICHIVENQTMWKCIQDYSITSQADNLTVLNFYEFWKLITHGDDNTALQHNFTFVMAQNHGVCTQMRWNIWQQELGRINLDQIVWGNSSGPTLNIKLDNFTADSNLIIDRSYCPTTEYLYDNDDNSIFLFDKQRVNTSIYLGSYKGLLLTNYNTMEEDDKFYSYRSGDNKNFGISIENLNLDSDAFINIKNHNSTPISLYSSGSLELTSMNNSFWNVSGTLQLTSTNSSTLKSTSSDIVIQAGDSKDKNIELNGKPISSGLITACDGITITNNNLTVSTGYITVSSDKRLKTNIHKYDNTVLDKIASIPIYTFNFKNNNKKHIGVIAQELEAVFDDPKLFINTISTENFNDEKSLNETKLIYIIWKGLQELYTLYRENKA